MTGLELAAVAWLIHRGGGGGGGTSKTKAGGGATKKKADAPSLSDVQKIANDAALVSRANQATAKRWAHTWRDQGLSESLAEGLARWAGLESSGSPTAVSKIGERGLLQMTGTTALKEGALTQGEWDSLTKPETTDEEHARVAHKMAVWLYGRAKRYVHNAPEGIDAPDGIDALWYAKLYHARPVDVRDGNLHGPALTMAHELAERWKDDPKKLHRLHVANVVAFGLSEP